MTEEIDIDWDKIPSPRGSFNMFEGRSVDIDTVIAKHGEGLKPDQFQALVKWVNWYRDGLNDRSQRQPLILQGPAGCGKSYLAARAMLACAEIKHGNLGLCAWTHEAVAVLESFAKAYGIRAKADTVMGILSLRLSRDRDHNGNLQVESSQKEQAYRSLSLCCVDESSMLEGAIIDQFAPESIPTVFMLDPYQLPPIERESEGRGISKTPQLSPITDVQGIHITLDQVIRYQGAVLELATAIRKIDQETGKLPAIKDFVEPGGNLVTVKPEELKARAIELFQDPDLNPKFLAWSNKDVDEWNRKLREDLHPEYTEPYTVGEVVIAKEQIVDPRTDEVIARASEMITILDVYTEAVDISFSGYAGLIEIIKLKIETPRMQQWVETIHPDTYDTFLELIKVHRAKIDQETNKYKRSRLWAEYYDFIIQFNLTVKGSRINDLILLPRLQYSYAMTIHQAQGKTFTHVLQKQSSLWRSKTPIWYKMRLAYTALTRASEQVIYG